MTMDIEIRRVENKQFRESLFDEYLDLVHTRMLEYFPDNKPLPEAIIRRWLEDDENETVISFNAFHQGQLVGQMDVITNSQTNPEYEINKGFGTLIGYVRKEFRNQGIGSELARKSLKTARENGLNTLKLSTHKESGDRFAQNLGAVMTCKISGMRLEMKNVDRNLIDEWLSIPSKNNSSWSVELHTKVTEQFISDVLDLSCAIHRDLISINGSDAKILREAEEKGLRDSGVYLEKYMKNYYCFLVKDEHGKTIGYTEAGIGHEDPERVRQYITGVATGQRGKGAGKYLKALMLDLIRTKHPEVSVITTGNNDLNMPMLGINTRLGFTKTDCETGYRLIIDEAQKRLEIK